MSLAHDLGKTLTEVGEMDLDEIGIWAAWYAESDPALFEDLRTGVLASTIANCALFSKGGYKPED
ncbi:MAG: hypothetical protein IT445_11415, partial [Phycisphaeraceae bacterium]|nr:hypothetical protein [Phycisphaeraceae bacterium]